jgi:hypothetical protein
MSLINRPGESFIDGMSLINPLLTALLTDNPTLLYANNGLRIQGLLQIHADFCLSARAGCAGCPLAERLGLGGCRSAPGNGCE